ncbi:DUF2306 domain-containing protein [Actinokineospora fastidiosa]|uniref:DUF2306 domain-containing protein n=1 Tax=Actinokineospora fastidiosa TaxID=1816 RepID=A0A918GSC9_9PSEU|nr:DUF2306 domain-containing protein [Actinokineospora fastidiosa]GGS57908.1 hypothetical protein GCM10010171_61160 [Actinokineospora fastidiosa]
MTQEMDRVRTQAPDPDDLPPRRPVATEQAKPFWRRPWMIPLWLVTAAFLYLQAGPFVGTPEAEAPVPPHDGFPAYYPLLLIHISFATVAMVTATFQVWPWLRKKHPGAHRVTGWAYAVSTVISGVCGLIIVPFAPVVGQVGVTMSTTLWIATTVVAVWAARTNRFALHRRFMLYSFALVMNNVWGLAAAKIIIGYQIQMDFTYLAEFARWVGWIVNLMLVQWWLYRTARRPVEGRARRAAAVR